jgi:hypothetical protein
MAYIGKEPADAFTSFVKQDFSTSATTSYTLDHSVVNENELALFINFVRQEPTTAYTASGTTLTLTSATASTDDMYCVYLGKAIQTVNPPNGSVGASQLASDAVTAAKLNDDIISGQTALGATPADTDELLISDAGTIKRVDYSYIKAVNTPAFEAILTADTSQLSNDTDTKITFNSETYDSDGTYDTSNGRFTPAVAGKYFIYGKMEYEDTNVGATDEHMVKIYKNGSQAGVFFNYPNTNRSIITYHEVFDMNTTDYIEIYAKINNSDGGRVVKGAPANQNPSTFGAFKIIGA